MKNIIYLVTILFFLSLSLFSCKNNGNKKIEIEESLNEVSSEVIDQLDQKESKHSIQDFQGIWESFSEYLEHQSEFKDYNQNKYYKIVNVNEVLDITISRTDNNLILDEGYFGFSNAYDSKTSLSEDVLINSLKESGKLLIKFKKGLKAYSTKDIEISTNFNRYFDVAEILDDDFDYGDKKEKVSFRLVSSVPQEIFNQLKNRSKIDKVNYIKEYRIKKQSKKIKVAVNKTFFHTEMSSVSKRKAFLVKGDIAYLEEIKDDWVKVYYDDTIVSGGYLKRSDIEILE
ncbi:hypothetical protein [uncultured Aquimarina sp.]|uniref:hypothetical protein n=1 Tax=uncultured Aquimarina sp. TaxID=575652 RepID=UPI00261014D4|nr:hypothetical protein [uncultured Aquimarina sp.]